LHGCLSPELFDRIVLIYNPLNHRVLLTLAESVRDDLHRRLPDMPVTVEPTRYAGHARELAAAAAATGRPLIQIDGEVMHVDANSQVVIDCVPHALTTVG
jgi:hypothetical protein